MRRHVDIHQVRGPDREKRYRYYPVFITPKWSGFGEWDAEPLSERHYGDPGDLISDIAHGLPVYRLGAEGTPDGIADIRGLIHSEPPGVYVLTDWYDDVIAYFGVDYFEAE